MIPLEGTLPDRVPAPVSSTDAGRIEIGVSHDGEQVARETFAQDLIDIGRDLDNDLRIDDPTFSRRHAVLERRGPNQYVVHDLQSLNGLEVGGERVTTWAINDRDVVTVGAFELTFRVLERSEVRIGRSVPEFDVWTYLGHPTLSVAWLLLLGCAAAWLLLQLTSE